MKRCDVCEQPLHPRGRGVTGVCFPCRMAGAAFARRWMVDLRDAGVRSSEIATIVGVAKGSVRARIREALA